MILINAWAFVRIFMVILNRVMALHWCHFHSISWEIINEIWPDFAYVLILKTSRLELFRINFQKLITVLWPLIDVRISFLLNILRTNWWNLTKFCKCIYIDKIWAVINQYFFKLNIFTNINWHITFSLFWGYALSGGYWVSSAYYQVSFHIYNPLNEPMSSFINFIWNDSFYHMTVLIVILLPTMLKLANFLTLSWSASWYLLHAVAKCYVKCGYRKFPK